MFKINYGGGNVDLKNNDAILKINAPRGIGPDGEPNGSRVEGPYVVVHTQEDDRWAIVALHWCNDASEPELIPRLGLRWFYKITGFPYGYEKNPLWMVLPNAVSLAFLDKKEEHELSDEKVEILKKFLNEEINADELKMCWREKRGTT